jgi:hypothetical protein
MNLVVEVLHGLVVQQAVDRLGVRLLVRLVHEAAVLDAPLRHGQRVGHVAGDGDEGDQREPDIVQAPENAADQRDLQQRRQHVEQHEEQEELDAFGAALDHARQSAGLPLQMEAQRQAVQMLEGLQRDAADRPLRHLGEDAVPQLGEGLGRDARGAIGQQQPDRHGQHGHRRRARLHCERIHHALEQQGHDHIGELGDRQAGQRQQHAHPEVPGAGRPEIGQQMSQRCAARARERRGLTGGAASHGGHT